MLRIAILIQLAIWTAAVQAFFPWNTENHCGGNPACESRKSRRTEVDGAVVERETTVEGRLDFKLVQRAPRVS
jgi:hypothetical protein